MKTIPRKSAAREWAPFKRPGRRRQEFGPEPSGVGCSGPGAIGPDARGNLSGPLPEASKTCRRPILGLLADLGPRPGCASGGRGGARIPKSLFLVWGCRSPAPRPCAQGASLLGRASRPRARVFAPHAVRPRPGSPAQIPGPDPRPGSPARIPGPSRPRGLERARVRRTGPRAPRGSAQKRVSPGEGRGFSPRGVYSVDAGVTENISRRRGWPNQAGDAGCPAAEPAFRSSLK